MATCGGYDTLPSCRYTTLQRGLFATISIPPQSTTCYAVSTLPPAPIPTRGYCHDAPFPMIGVGVYAICSATMSSLLLVSMRSKNAFWDQPLHVASTPRSTYAVWVCGAPLEYRNRQGLTPLLRAADSGSLPVARLLFRFGASVKAPDTVNGEMLIVAVRNHNAAMTELALQMGSDPDLRILRTGESMLMLCVDSDGPADVVDALLRYGANVNLRDGTGSTPLINAVQRRRVDVVELLLRVPGIDVHAMNHRGATGFKSAQVCEHPVLISLLAGAGAKDTKHPFMLRE